MTPLKLEHYDEDGNLISGDRVKLEVKEVDGAPDVTNVNCIRVTNGTLTDDGNNQVTISTGGGGGGVDPELTYGGNLVRNYPSLEAADGAQPEWWEEQDANVTLTEEGAAGEGIPEKYERVLKVVNGGAGANKYIYQDFDEADENSLDDNVTKVSFSAWVYQKSTDVAGTITLELYDVDGAASLGTDTTNVQDAWTFLQLENITYQDSMQIRLYHNANSAIFYIAMPMLNVGEESLPWKIRRLIYRENYVSDVLDVDPANANWVNVDFTGNTSNITAALHLGFFIVDSGATYRIGYVSVDGTGEGQVDATMVVYGIRDAETDSFIICDDGQVIEASVSDAAVSIWSIALRGYWEWE